ncbi:hypothetical protein [Sphingobium olei]|uniref:Uncharacterized protein n=1 Tax=Sphingobium olei TaxID=420955 RepID=A0ABW3P1G1_9SPHN
MVEPDEALAFEQWWPHHESRTRKTALKALLSGDALDPVSLEFEDIKAIVEAGRREGLRQAADVARERAEKAIARPFDPEQGDTPENRSFDQAWKQGSYNALHCAANAITALMGDEG